MTPSLNFSRAGDKKNSPEFEDYLGRLLEERDRIGLTDCQSLLKVKLHRLLKRLPLQKLSL